MAFELGIMDAAVRKNLRNRVADGFADPELTLRAARGGVLFVVTGHNWFLNRLTIGTRQRKRRP